MAVKSLSFLIKRKVLHEAFKVNLVQYNTLRRVYSLSPHTELLSKLNFSHHHPHLCNVRLYNTMAHKTSIKISDYDIIGFDLDNTLLRYNLPEMVPLIYNLLAKFLVENCGYSKELLKPIEEDVEFLQKGLMLDLEKGNVIRLSTNGYIERASHGTRFLSDDKIVSIYGPERIWDIGKKYSNDPLEAWNGPLSEQVRALLDSFDMPTSLAFARAIDAVDSAANKQLKSYNVWSDVLQGLIHIYSRDQFANGKSEYFKALKNDPGRYVLKTDPKVIEWVKQLKKTKAIYLLTGSHIDFANLTATEALGKNWRELFDVIICFARKPGFFMQNNKFFEVNGTKELQELKSGLHCNEVYSQGNWLELVKFLSHKLKLENPKCVYIGDNIIQDVYTPKNHANSDSIAVVEELLSCMVDKSSEKKFNNYTLESKLWGPYFGSTEYPTIWTNLIRKYSKICVPTIDYLAQNPIDYEYECFKNNQYKNLKGFYPVKPKF